MRIIGGMFKGRAIATLPDTTIRPTTDRVKESIFNLIQNEVEGAKTLDLFAGSGALGIEALSRGAESVLFVDKSRQAIDIVKQNLAKLGDVNYDIIIKDYRSAIDELSRRGKKFDIILLDPPYLQGLEADILIQIERSNILSEDGIIVLERSREDKAYKLPKSIGIVDSRNYGSTNINILKYATKVAVTGTFDPFTNGHRFLVDTAVKDFDIVHIVILKNPDKEVTFNLRNRLKYIEQSTKDIRKKVRIESFDGLAIDYCHNNGIEYIIRGVRNEQDLAYEKAMADYNLKEGKVQTILVPAENNELSSTLVKETIKNGGDLDGLVDHTMIKRILSEGKKWRT